MSKSMPYRFEGEFAHIDILINYDHLMLALRDNRSEVMADLEDAEHNARIFHDQAVWMRDHNWHNKAIMYQNAASHHNRRAMAYRLAIQEVEKDM